ncbi:hypothetical protein [Chromobacterium subtsugae]|uniref:hypothetical protein n=1 Tax=Chromobacterium subtsugae TaxID=251747 RepID=UPI00064103BC|nr:hypothetical protein [Chromobacterium subtsugae]
MNETIEKKDATAFSEAWWADFMDRSQNLSKPVVVKNAIPQEKFRHHQQNVLSIIADLAKLKTTQFGYRIYIEGRLLGPNEMDDIFEKSAPLENEELETWAARVFGDQRFGIILNSGEKFNQALSKEIAVALAPLFDEIGYPRGGVQFTIFIGNYDKTPLGIHQDQRGESVIHFHVGPGSKTMYVWDREQYKNLLETQNLTRKDFAKLRPYASEFHFESGDLYFMPEGTYHIGMQEGLSVGITVWRYSHTDDLLAKHLHQRIFKQIPVEKTEDFQHDENSLDDTSGLDKIIEKYSLTDECKNLNYSELLRKTYQDWRYSVHSNAGYRNSPFPREGLEKIALQDRIAIESPYKILARESENTDKIYIYVRGHKIEFNRFPCVLALIQRLNEGRTEAVADLLQILDKSWPAQVGLYILNELYHWRGIDKVAGQ